VARSADVATSAPPAAQIEGPFGPADHVESMPVSTVLAKYRTSFGYDPAGHLAGLAEMSLYRCRKTGLEFWRPERLAGDESFYRELSGTWDDYYKAWRWEYDHVHKHLSGVSRLLEIGCGRGYFLKSTEGLVSFAKGLELNKEAIANRVTRWDVESLSLSELAAREPHSYDLVCSFQVLEHVVDPAAFIEHSLAAVRPGGLLAFSVPNYAHRPFQKRQDPLDLPPHHMNHFKQETLSRIANHFGIEIVKVYKETRQYWLGYQSDGSPISKAKTAANKAVKRLLNAYYSRTGEPGHTMLVIFKV
jgi:2-polyprenyl-3-methyl-5-hydroxy-6-metoxy-1,4-benzoquinol methylase